MKLYLKFDINSVCKKVLQEQLDNLGIDYSMVGFGEVEIQNSVASDVIKKLHENLNNYGISVVETHKSILVQKIKDAITEMIYSDEKISNEKTSVYLADKIGVTIVSVKRILKELQNENIIKREAITGLVNGKLSNNDTMDDTIIKLKKN